MYFAGLGILEKSVDSRLAAFVVLAVVCGEIRLVHPMSIELQRAKQLKNIPQNHSIMVTDPTVRYAT
jgi:hypothetical protein